VHKNRFHPKFFGIGKPVAVWTMDANSMIERSLPITDCNRNDCTEMFYQTAFFSVSFPEDPFCGRIVASFEPKYGVSYTYPIIPKENDIIFGEPEIKSVC